MSEQQGLEGLHDHECLRNALLDVMENHGGIHDADCPLDDTCDCRYKSFNGLLNRFASDLQKWPQLVKGATDAQTE